MSRLEKITEGDRQWAEEARCRFPDLTSFGYGTPGNMSDAWSHPFSDDDVRRVTEVKNFLKEFKPNRRVVYGQRSSPTATQVKSLMSKFLGVYVYEGDVILAASALGIPIRKTGSHHAQIGINRRQFKNMLKLF